MNTEKFASGAHRDVQQGKLRYDLMSPLANLRLAEVFTKGAEKYGDRNWEKGIPYMRMYASAMRHLQSFLLGQEDEDHLAQATWNLYALLHYDEAIARELLSDELDDRPLKYVGADEVDLHAVIAAGDELYKAMLEESENMALSGGIGCQAVESCKRAESAPETNAPGAFKGTYSEKEDTAVDPHKPAAPLWTPGQLFVKDLVPCTEWYADSSRVVHYRNKHSEGVSRDFLDIESFEYAIRKGELKPKPEITTEAPVKPLAGSNLEILESRRSVMLHQLYESGCPSEVARQIVKGTTFADTAKGSTAFVYIAGPMRGFPKFNFPAFDQARDMMVAKGWNVISPADIDRAADKDHETLTPAQANARTASYVDRDTQALLFLARVNPTTDNAILMLPGWEKSKGACGEFYLARWLGLDILDYQGRGGHPDGFVTEHALDVLEMEDTVE